MHTTVTEIHNILTRTTGFLKTVSSHSAQPYRGCAFGRSLCGVACYVQHNVYLTRGRGWGGFLEARLNAADSYRRQYPREQAWGRQSRGEFGVFLSSSTEPFLPQEFRFGVTRRLLETMLELPPDRLIVQTHSHRVGRVVGLLQCLDSVCRLRVHISIESDLERLPNLPPPPCSVEARFRAAHLLKSAGIQTVVTVSPLLPILDPERFFDRVARSANAVVIDHFVGGDGTPDGSRTRRTPLPEVMERVLEGSAQSAYRDRIVEIAERRMPGRVGVSIDGFAGRYRGGPPEPSSGRHASVWTAAT